MKKRPLIYTAVFGRYETPKPVNPEPGVTYQMFTDGVGADGWDILPWPTKGKPDPRSAARQIKILMPILNPLVKWSLWLDGSMQIRRPVKDYFDRIFQQGHQFAAFHHNEWDNPWTEIDACEKRRKDTPERLGLMREVLEVEGYPREGGGQPATGILFRDCSMRVRTHAKLWWETCKGTTLRDQCSFMAMLTKVEGDVHWLPGKHTSNKLFKYTRGHK